MRVNDLAKWIDELQGNISVIKQQLAALSGSASDVPDFDIDTPEDGQTLIYDGSDSKWKNAGIEPGGGSRYVLFQQEYGAFPASITLSESYENYDALIFCLYKGDDTNYYDLFDAYVDKAVLDDVRYGTATGRTNALSLSGWQIQSGHSQWVRYSVDDATTLTRIGTDGTWGISKVIGIKFT